MSAEAKEPLHLFYCYSHKDKDYRDELDNHLSNLKHQNIIKVWSDHEISPGTDWEKAIDTHLNTAHIILLLTSADFMASNYCYSIEMKHALDRHKAGTARVIPIILRPHDWKDSPYDFLQVLPTNAKPVIQWLIRDEAFYDIVQGIRKAINELQTTVEKAQENIKEDSGFYRSINQEIEQITKEVSKDNERKKRLDRFLFTLAAFLNTWLSFPKEDGVVIETAYIDQTRNTATTTINELNETLAFAQSRNLLDEKITGEILDIIKKLRLLEVKRFYLDGGKSWKEFSDLADDISTSMRNLIEEIRKRMLLE